jgi:hypothetical protein
MRRLRLAILLLLCSSGGALAAYDANGVALGASEDAIKRRFPSIHCKALEWKSKAAERRCDDAKIAFAGGVQARITFYLGRNAVQAFDVRFDTRDVERVAAFLKKQYGAPMAETRDTLERKDKNDKDKKPRVIYKVRWEAGKDRAVLFSEMDKRSSSLLASRGDFEEEIYKVR